MRIPKLQSVVLTVIFTFSAVFIQSFDKTSPTPLGQPLEQIPLEIGKWRASGGQGMGEDIETVLGVDDYIMRNYNAQGLAVNVYVSFFSYTDRGKGYHSPLNCMPGSGWNIARTEPVTLQASSSGQEHTVNQLVLQNGRTRQVSLYWYQCRGRILHNEYVERIYRVVDSILKNRTDGAFIRLIATGSDESIEHDATVLKQFAAEFIPVLKTFLPE